MIKLIKSTFYHELEVKEKLCEFIMKTSILSMGTEVKKFESNFSKWQKRKYSVMFNSGSSANLALITSLKNLNRLQDNDCVGFSKITWATNVMPLIQNNLSPIPIEVNINNLNMDICFLKDDIKCLFITNVLGFCSKNMFEIKKYCEEKGILLLEDNCESFGSEFKKIKLGNFGLASTFSFFVGHHLSTIEGGMVCTDDKKLYEMLKMVREHGWTRNSSEDTKDAFKRIYEVDDFYNKYTFYYSAYNLRPTEIQGFLGNLQLKYADEIINKRENNFKLLSHYVSNNEDMYSLDVEYMNKISNFAFPLVFKSKALCEVYKKKFQESNVEIRPIVSGDITSQPFYKYQRDNNNIASVINNNGFYIPNNPELTADELTTICGVLKK